MKLNHTLLPMIDYHKAKRLIWDPRDIDCEQDKRDWAAMSDREHDLILRGGSLFVAGEEAVAHDLSPLLIAIRREGGHIEDEMFLTTQVFEEARHFEWFDRWLSEVPGRGVTPPDYLGANYVAIFYHDLPDALMRLLTDTSREAQAEAATVYHIVIEGVLAETGYYGFAKALKSRGLLPGLVRGVELVQRDEARHIAFGIYLLQRLIAEEPALLDAIDARMNDLLPKALDVIGEVLMPYGDDVPFGLDPTDMLTYAGDQFARRMDAIERVTAKYVA